MRELVIDGVVWRYKVGRSNVSARSEGGRVYTDLASNVTGTDVERGRHKRTRDGMVTPGDVRAWIIRRTTDR